MLYISSFKPLTKEDCKRVYKEGKIKIVRRDPMDILDDFFDQAGKAFYKGVK